MPGSEFEPRNERVEQGASEARKRPGGAFVARCACRGAVVPRASLVARSIKHHNEGCGAFSFTLPWVGEGSADGAARGKGGVLFRKREHPLYIPQRKACIAGLGLEWLHALRSVGAVYVASPRIPASHCRYQPRALRSARVTLPRRQTAVRAAALLRSPPFEVGTGDGRHCFARRREVPVVMKNDRVSGRFIVCPCGREDNPQKCRRNRPV